MPVVTRSRSPCRQGHGCDFRGVSIGLMINRKASVIKFPLNEKIINEKYKFYDHFNKKFQSPILPFKRLYFYFYRTYRLSSRFFFSLFFLILDNCEKEYDLNRFISSAQNGSIRG